MMLYGNMQMRFTWRAWMLIIEELIKSWEISLPLIQCDRLGLITLFEHIAGISLLMQGDFSILK